MNGGSMKMKMNAGMADYGMQERIEQMPEEMMDYDDMQQKEMPMSMVSISKVYQISIWIIFCFFFDKDV